MHHSTRVGIGVLVAATVAGFVSMRPTQARPPYKAKEGVSSCTFCHKTGEDNKPIFAQRNYRGRYYQKHALSFEGFDDYAESVAGGEKMLPGDKKPASQTNPAPISEAHEKVAAAQAAHEKMPDDAALKKAYVDSLTDFGHLIMTTRTIPAEPRFTDVIRIETDVLGLDPANATALADKATAEKGLKRAQDRAKARAAAGATPPAADGAKPPAP